MTEGIVSPLTGGPAHKVRSLAVADLVSAYKQEHGIDVTPYLPARDALDVYECDETGLQFFAGGAELEGPPEFYASLYSGDGADWGYQETKWEFAQGLSLLGGADKLLDVGCGGGDFLSFIKGKVGSAAGLETSEFGRDSCRAKGVEAHDEMIGAHAERHEGAYDAVTAFQVLEHVADPAAFIRGCVKALKPGGRLLLSVPNNDSFLNRTALLPLNAPPHHLTLWPRKALEALEKLYPLELMRVEKEPLQEANVAWYQTTMEKNYLPGPKIARKIYYRFGGATAFGRFLRENRETIDGHTILALYRKT